MHQYRSAVECLFLHDAPGIVSKLDLAARAVQNRQRGDPTGPADEHNSGTPVTGAAKRCDRTSLPSTQNITPPSTASKKRSRTAAAA